MKKLILASSLFTAMAFMFTSCLKDKGFENGTYGINLDGTPPGIGFPEGAKAINAFSVNSLSTPQVVNAPFVNLLSGQPAQTDVHVTLQLDPTIVAAYNAANGTNLVIPTAAQYNIGTLNLTIPAGQRNVVLPINIPNATLLSLTQTYALGFKIVSVDGGYQIADNLKSVLITISVKNAYDGIYSYISGFVQRYSAPGVPICCDGLTGPLGPNNPDIILSTSGPYTVSVPIAGTPGTFTWSGGSSGVAGIDGVTLTVDPVTNLVTVASAGNATLTNWAGHVNKYDPATKRFYLAFIWNPASTTRTYEVILEYDRPR